METKKKNSPPPLGTISRRSVRASSRDFLKRSTSPAFLSSPFHAAWEDVAAAMCLEQKTTPHFSFFFLGVISPFQKGGEGEARLAEALAAVFSIPYV